MKREQDVTNPALDLKMALRATPITFAHILLAKACHVAMPNQKRPRKDNATVCLEGEEKRALMMILSESIL